LLGFSRSRASGSGCRSVELAVPFSLVVAI
jgi:hypothetical protein